MFLGHDFVAEAKGDERKRDERCNNYLAFKQWLDEHGRKFLESSPLPYMHEDLDMLEELMMDLAARKGFDMEKV